MLSSAQSSLEHSSADVTCSSTVKGANAEAQGPQQLQSCSSSYSQGEENMETLSLCDHAE